MANLPIGKNTFGRLSEEDLENYNNFLIHQHSQSKLQHGFWGGMVIGAGFVGVVACLTLLPPEWFWYFTGIVCGVSALMLMISAVKD